MTKDKKMSIGITGVILIFIAILSSIMVGLYPKINANINDENLKQFTGQMTVNDFMIESSYALYYQLILESQTESIMPSDIYLKDNYKLNEYYTINGFNERIERGYKDLLDKRDVVDHYGYSTENKDYITNIDSQKLKVLENGGEIGLAEYYDYWVILSYDSEGVLKLENIDSRSNESAKELIYQQDSTMRYAFTEVGQSITPIKNMIYFYGIKDMDSFDPETSNYNFSVYEDVIKQYIVGVSIIGMLAFLIIPYKWLEMMKWLKKILKLPFELLIGGIILNALIHLNTGSYEVQEYLEGRLTVLFGFYLPDPIETKAVVILGNVMEWGVYLLGIFILVSLVKHIYAKGIINYVRQTSIFYYVIAQINQYKENFINRLSQVELQEKNIYVILRFIVINAIILSIFCLFGILGILGIILYSIILYFLAGRVLKNIKHYYEQLLQRTSNLAQGYLTAEAVEENLGMFEPIKQHIQVIQEDFKKSVEEEVKAQKFKTDLITNVSHDLKTPLTSIISYVDLLKQENLSEEQRQKYIDILERKSSRLQTLIEDLFEMSKASSGHIELYKEQVDLVALIKQTLFELEDKIEVSGITFRKQFPEQKVYLELDGMRTFRVFDNLINNITKYGMPNSRAYIDIHMKSEAVVITLKNTAREELTFDTDYITERFVRGDESRNTEGSGLGLAIAKSFVELQGGKFEIQVDGDLFKVIITFESHLYE